MIRRLPALVLTVAAIVTLVVVTRRTPVSSDAVFSERQAPWMPAVSENLEVPSTWFCPGVPARGDGVGGELILVNRTQRPLEGRLTFLADADRRVSRPITLDGFERRSIDLDEELTADYVSAVVELEGSGAMVEQRAVHPAGDAVAPCANRTSSQWYLADGFTVDGSIDELVLTNPYDVDAVDQHRHRNCSRRAVTGAIPGLSGGGTVGARWSIWRARGAKRGLPRRQPSPPPAAGWLSAGRSTSSAADGSATR